jgi:hypothetical protein
MVELASSERGRCNTKGVYSGEAGLGAISRYPPKNAGALWREREVSGRLAAREGTDFTSRNLTLDTHDTECRKRPRLDRF